MRPRPVLDCVEALARRALSTGAVLTDAGLAKRVTTLLLRWRSGDHGAGGELMELVYPELHGLARRYPVSERRGHSLQATALVNEAFLRLMGSQVEWTDRVHFFAVAASAMRPTGSHASRNMSATNLGANRG